MADKILMLPEYIQNAVNRYFNLELGDKKVPCPYFMNLKKSKDLRAMVGKGTPAEIEMEAKIWEKLKGINFDNMTVGEIREFLMQRGIGIDCSGFVMHVFNEWYKKETKKSIWRKMKPMNKSFLYKIAYLLKPVEKLGAEIITNEENAIKVNLTEVLPGDVIRTKWKRKNSHHVLLVSKVIKDNKGMIKEIEYVNSAEYYGIDNGMRYGKIIIVDFNKPLQDQKWEDFDANGTNHIYEGYLYQVEDNGIRRLKALSDLILKYNK